MSQVSFVLCITDRWLTGDGIPAMSVVGKSKLGGLPQGIKQIPCIFFSHIACSFSPASPLSPCTPVYTLIISEHSLTDLQWTQTTHRHAPDIGPYMALHVLILVFLLQNRDVESEKRQRTHGLRQVDGDILSQEKLWQWAPGRRYYYSLSDIVTHF